MKNIKIGEKMKDITTYETSIRLKEAGFPQPTPEPGQFWYTSAGLLCWIARKELRNTFILCDTTGTAFRTLYVEFSKDLLFAPTATDILRELPDQTALHRVNMDMFLCWIRKDRAPMIGDGPCMVDAAEAAAEGWIEWKEKTTQK